MLLAVIADAIASGPCQPDISEMPANPPQARRDLGSSVTP
jgi:hypothetical protein